MEARIRVKRVYDEPSGDDGFRVLVDRLWPRGMKKGDVRVDLWLPDVAPSTALRKWFSHDPSKWEEFKRRYFVELDEKKEVIKRLVEIAREGTLTLLFSARDVEHNQAVALRDYLLSLISKGGGEN
jgi:uncharacterized protein YeaO (DUF488 family)